MRRTTALLSVLGFAAALVACGETISAPVVGSRVPMALSVQWPSSATANAVFGASIDTVSIFVSRQNESTAASALIPFPAGQSEFRFALDVPLLQEVETLYVYVDMRAGGSTLYYASQEVVLRERSVPALPPLDLYYVGPGYDAALVTITQRVTFVVPGGSVQYSATAQNASQQPSATPIGWSVSDRKFGSITANGLFTASQTQGKVWVRAFTPSGVADSLQVTIGTQLP